ncbi:uncharacterized protein LOC117902013 [Drosophila subobscura]|uniref:uncharacterized protein LOC117902013 n=1 Tax=Drosophila subobscura TaxID=7241 RepID=UPI00155A991E|nr:uncharacterized protein LOC117902013 [Drosophila subobscura]
MAELKTFSLLANVCKCFHVRGNAFSCWSRALNKNAISTLNMNSDTLQESQGNTGWSKNGPLSTLLRNVSESMKLIERTGYECSKVATQQKVNGNILQRHLPQKQNEQQVSARSNASPRPVRVQGGLKQKLMDLMKSNITQRKQTLFGCNDSSLVSKYARISESRYEGYASQSKPNWRDRKMEPPVEGEKPTSYRQENVWNIKKTPPKEYTTLPESRWIREQQSLKEQQRLKEQLADYIDIASITNKIKRNDRIMRCIRGVEHNAHLPVDFKPQVYRHGYHWNLKQSEIIAKYKDDKIPEMIKMQQQQKRKKEMSERKDLRKVTKKQQLPQRTVSEVKIINKAKKVKKSIMESSSKAKLSKRYPRRG